MPKKKAVVKKKKFINMEITRVKMNPEQAVLSCCNATEKPLVSAGFQCLGPGLECGVDSAQASAS